MRAVGVDLGGTKLAAGVLDDDGTLADYTEVPLPGRDYNLLLDAIAEQVGRVRERRAIPPALGVAVAAWLSPDRETVAAAASLGWADRTLRRDLAARAGLDSVVVHNDANAAAWGEYVIAGRPADGAFVMLTLGTDVGGGVIAGGRLLTGAFGLAGEIGHLQLRPDGPQCVCGSRGCLAVYASGTAMLARARHAVAADPARCPELSGLCGADPARLRGQDLAAAAQGGEPTALAIVAEAGAAIAAASAQISRVVDHHTLVLGGGASAIGPALQQAVTAALTQSAPVGPVRPVPEVRLARAGNQAGVLGAADLASAAQ
jgi:glucokinase